MVSSNNLQYSPSLFACDEFASLTLYTITVSGRPRPIRAILPSLLRHSLNFSSSGLLTGNSFTTADDHVLMGPTGGNMPGSTDRSMDMDNVKKGLSYHHVCSSLPTDTSANALSATVNESPLSIQNWARRYVPSFRVAHSSMLFLMLICLAFFTNPTSAVLISNFENCLATGYKATKALQFTPEFVDVVFDTSNSAHNLRVTIWGNVSGSVYDINLPPPSSSQWTDPDVTDGKIVNYTASTNKLTTLSSKVAFLSYEPYSSASAFCGELRSNQSCPLAPVFGGNSYVLHPLRLCSFF